MLVQGQQRIISQGVAQYLQQQRNNSSAAAAATSGATQGATGSQVTATRPVPSAAGTSVETTCHASSGSFQ